MSPENAHVTTAVTSTKPPPEPARPLSSRLYNDDLAPPVERRWKTYSIFALWMNDVHNIGNYTFAAGLFAIGLGAVASFFSLLIGILVVFWGMNLMGRMGQRTGVPFPVMSRISFGIHGAQIPALIRAVIAIAWYGIQTYLASLAVVVLALRIDPGLKPMTEDSILGLSSLGWICFVGLWVAQLVILTFGMEIIRKFQDWAGPAVWLVMLAMAVWMFVLVGDRISWTPPDALTGSAMWWQMLGAAGLTISTYGTLMLNFCDFSRFAPDTRSVVRGNFWGLPVNFTAFAMVSIVVTAGSYTLYGDIITDPAKIIAKVPNTFVLVVGALMFAFATIGVNIVANFVSPAYDLANLAPKYIDFRRGGIISAVLAVAVLPWNLYNNPTVVNIFLAGLGAVLGPLFGVIMVDYWLLRRAKVNVPELYTTDPGGEYAYSRGFNLRALTAFLPSAAIATVLALTPGFEILSAFSWFIGAVLAGAVYFVVADRNQTFTDVSGEHLGQTTVAAGIH
ncbi:NCS1 family nucleobase:cation symporter-1 [Streptomyces winkii]|uniref:NCS1 family nucleobase:cation symporter-1 n=1 Tax=Streptomyces winkii TaxID=3051178 RepID=UPI0028D542DB|nr:NCS1 family nucleobase:cation symporter-1 [Streptomyces sp. DSM 40971]